MAGAGVGALTSYLVGEVFAEIGMNGFAGQALQTTVSSALSTIASNITEFTLSGQTHINGAWRSGLEGFNFASVAGSFLGSKLASFVHDFDSVGGQIGFSVGGTLGSIAATMLLSPTGVIANFLGPGVGAFVGALLGGAIGSVFGGDTTPESGAHVVWDPVTNTFKTGTIWADDWGSTTANQQARDRATDMAETAGDVLNRIVEGLGDGLSAYRNPTAIGAGAYGQRAADWVYWHNGENSAYTSYEEAIDAINHGLRTALGTVTIQGGDIYLKRALYKSLEMNPSAAEFDFSQLVGDLSVAGDMSFYQDNRALIDAAIALAPDSALAQGWVLTQLRAAEMDLDRYYKSDFYGGLGGFLDGSSFFEQTALTPGQVELAWGQNGDLVVSDTSAEPGSAAQMPGWASTYMNEARWSEVDGPYGSTVTAMETGQTNTGVSGGGGLTNEFAIDESKTYEFTIYFRKEDLEKHSIYLGTTGSAVVDAVSGAVNSNPYFMALNAGSQQTLFEEGRWYKAVGYILPEGARLSSHADKGGIYDTVTGERVYGVKNFAWNPARTKTTAHLRYFNFYDETQQGYSTYWYQPEVRALDGASRSTNLVDMDGWSGATARLPEWTPSYSAETRWAEVAGPNGQTITAMETGQTDTGAAGGGGVTHQFAVDGSKTYEFTIYVRKADLDKHSLYFGTQSATVVDAVTGTVNTNPYFVARSTTSQASVFSEDRWYKIVAYVLPEGERLASHADKGGIYDTVTGEKVGNVANFAWNPARAKDESYLRFFNFYNETQQGYSTYWYQPEVRVVDGNQRGANLINLSGWGTPSSDMLVLPDFADTMGYSGAGTTSTSYTGTVYSDVMLATGSANISLSDSTSANTASGPGTGNSRLSDDIFVGNVGNNILHGYAGWDWLDGGDGVDQIFGDDGDDVIIGGAGNDYVQNWTAGPAPGGLYGGDGNDRITGGEGKDALFGQEGDDILYADQDSLYDHMDGGNGIDTVSFAGFDTGATVDMNVGKDASYTARPYGDGWRSIENVAGSKFADTLTGDALNNELTGSAGDDTINGGNGTDVIIGGTGADYLHGGGNSDILSYRTSESGVTVSLTTREASGGDAEGDTVLGFEYLEGSEQADVLQGWTGSTQLYGLDGNDRLRASSGATRFEGGEGIDTVDYSDSTAGVTANLSSSYGYNGWAAGDRYYSVEQVLGSAYADALYGGDGSERLQGNGGSDNLYGGLGDDSYALTQGSGYDYITETGGDYDYAVVGRDVTLDQFTLSRSVSNTGSTLVLYGGSDRFYVGNHFSEDANQLDRLSWENGSTIWISLITATYNGGTANDTVTGGNSFDFLHGRQGNDTLTGGIGLDILIGGSGNDAVRGGTDADVYVFGRGSGIDTITDDSVDHTRSGYDTLVMADDISADELLIDYSGSNLYIGLKVPGNEAITAFNAPDRVVINNQKDVRFAIETLRIGGQDISLPQLAGDVTDSNTRPQVTSQTWTKYAPISAGQLGSLPVFDADGDDLTLTITGVTGGSGYFDPDDFYFLGESNSLYTYQGWTAQDVTQTTISVNVSDGTNVTPGTIKITWRPDPDSPAWPIVLDLDGDGVSLVEPLQSDVEWDVDEDGRVDKIGWAAAGDAFLALDRDGSGTINNINEISFINDVEGATTDLEGLRGFDFDANDVADGVIDAHDIFFHEFRIWQDLNQNGISEADELRTLAEAGIEGIRLAGTPTGKTVEGSEKNIVLNTGEFVYADGETGVFGDVALGVVHGTADGEAEHEEALNGRELGQLMAGKAGGDKPAKEASDAPGGRITPVILDLDLDGINLTPIGRSPVEFDGDNDGVNEWVGWAGAGDGILALDIDGDGKISRGEEISFTQYKLGAETDLEGLTAFDVNADGVLNAGDEKFSSFVLWRDGNMDGVSQESELGGLSDYDVTSISLSSREHGYGYGGNIIHAMAKFEFDNGNVGAVGDVMLGYVELAEGAMSDGAATQVGSLGERLALIQAESQREMFFRGFDGIGKRQAAVTSSASGSDGVDPAVARKHNQLVSAMAIGSDDGFASLRSTKRGGWLPAANEMHWRVPTHLV